MSFLSHLEENTVNALISEKHSAIERDKIRFGVRLVFNDFWKVMIVYLIAFLLDVAPATLLTHVTFFLLRQVCFGFHFQNSWDCLVSSILLLPIAVFLISNWNLGSIYIFLLAFVSTFLLLFFAPAGTQKRPVFSKEHKRYLRNKLFIRLSIVWIIVLLLRHDYQFFALYAILLIALSVITQKLKGEMS